MFLDIRSWYLGMRLDEREYDADRVYRRVERRAFGQDLLSLGMGTE